MKSEHITIQTIAEYLGLSRNTVSKALNGQYVPPRTREKVLNAAIELGYKSYRSVAETGADVTSRRLVLITSKLLMTMTFFVQIMRSIESALLEEENIELLQFTTTKTSFLDKLVNFLQVNKVDGIICMELFQKDYVTKIIELGYPVVFFDFPMQDATISGNYDVILPESFDAVKNLCSSFIHERECKSFGFVGDFLHCRSFYERFLGMREALFRAGIAYDPAYSIAEKDSFPYGEPKQLYRLLSRMTLPDCFIAANDAIGIALSQALKLCRKKIPSDVCIVGFDNIPEAKTNNPPLTTFSVDKNGLGRKILTLLLERINHPHSRTQFVHVQSKLIVRQTT